MVLIFFLRVGMLFTSPAVAPFSCIGCFASGHDANPAAPTSCDEKQHSPCVSRPDPTRALFSPHFVSRCSEPIGVEISFLGLDWLKAVLANMV
jgi:hypothetical protein